MDNANEQTETRKYSEFPGLPHDLSTPEVRLDLESPLEIALIIVGLVGIAVTIGLIANYGPDHLYYIPLSLVFTVFVFYLRFQTDCTYILDNAKQVFLYRRTILGFGSDTHVCSFSEVQCVAAPGEYIKTKHGGFWNYYIVLVLRSGEMITLTSGYNGSRALDACNYYGKMLAEHIGTEFFRGENEKGIGAQYDERKGIVSVSYNDGQSFVKKRNTFIIGFVILTVLATTLFSLLMITRR